MQLAAKRTNERSATPHKPRINWDKAGMGSSFKGSQRTYSYQSSLSSLNVDDSEDNKIRAQKSNLSRNVSMNNKPEAEIAGKIK